MKGKVAPWGVGKGFGFGRGGAGVLFSRFVTQYFPEPERRAFLFLSF